MYKKLYTLICFSIFSFSIQAQLNLGGTDSTAIDLSTPKEYEIGGITITGASHMDQNVLILLSVLSV